MSKNNVDRFCARSNVKTDTLTNKSDADGDMKIKHEETLPSQGSNLDLDDVSQEEKPHFTAKRKREVSPLLVSNLPERYSLLQITDYLVKTCGSCEVSFLKNGDGNAVEVIFESTSQRSKAKMILSLQSIDDQKIRVESPISQGYSDSGSDNESPQAKRKKDPEEAPWGLDMDLWRPDPRGWYGVKPQYLNSLGVEGTIRNWVLVKNFRCGNEELREVMSLAGEVQVCSVSYSVPKRYARVMYKHPLEALQAVSMINDQVYYGTPLSVKMIKACGAILPKGLKNIGPGLSKYGGPLRDIIQHYERFVKGQDNDLNTIFFRTPKQQATNDNYPYSVHLNHNSNKKKARDALKTLIALVDQGMKVNELVLELKSIKAGQKNSMDELLKELDAESKSDTKVQNTFKDQNRDTQPSPISSDSSGCDSRPMSPDIGRNSKEPAKIATVTSNRSKETVWPSGPKIPTIASNRAKIPQSVAPGTTPSYRGALQRHMGPAAMTPGPTTNSVRPIDQRSAFGSGVQPMGLISGPMPGPMPAHNPGVIPGSMPAHNPGVIPGSMPAHNPGVIPGSMPAHNPGMIPGSMPVSGPAGPMTGPMMAPNLSMPGPNTHPPFGPNVHQTSGNEATLQFSNLPLSTTFALLSDKLSEVGQLSSIQFTTPGCVLVTFAHKAFAEKCRLQFDQSRFKGNLIDVRFV